MEKIPLHDFSRDDATSIPFQHVPLEQTGNYDSSIPHRHNYYEVFVFEKGGGNHEIDFSSFPIKDRSIHFVSPGQVHTVKRKAPSYGHVLLFSRDFYSMNMRDSGMLNELPFLNNNSTNPVLNLTEEEFSVLRNITLSMEKEQNSEDPLKEDLIRSFLIAFLIYCKRYFKVDKSEASWTGDTIAFRFRRLIEKNFSKCHSVSDYAEMLNVSEKQLNATVKNQVGLNPSELIYDRIILEAKRLVLFTDYSFQEIAYFLNYSDPSHFTKFFKSKTGLSPGDFRKKGEKYQS